MRIPKKLATPVAFIGMSIGILSSTVPMVTYAAETPEIQSERYLESEKTEINPVTEDIVYEVYGEIGGGKASMDENKLQIICERIALQYDNIDPYVLHALCIQETRGRDNVNDVYTNASALGITQIEPSVHKDEIEGLGYTNNDIRNNPEAAIAVAAKILSDRIDARDGDVYKALIDYNMGQNKANEKFAKNPNYRWEYADNVLNMANLFEIGLDLSTTYEEDINMLLC